MKNDIVYNQLTLHVHFLHLKLASDTTNLSSGLMLEWKCPQPCRGLVLTIAPSSMMDAMKPQALGCNTLLIKLCQVRVQTYLLVDIR